MSDEALMPWVDEFRHVAEHTRALAHCARVERWVRLFARAQAVEEMARAAERAFGPDWPIIPTRSRLRRTTPELLSFPLRLIPRHLAEAFARLAQRPVDEAGHKMIARSNLCMNTTPKWRSDIP